MKNVLITGVSRGMGKAFAEKFLSEGWNVIGTSTSGKSSLVNKNLYVYKLDISMSESIRKFIEKFKEAGEKIDVLINNAGIYLNEEFPMKREELQKTLDVNLIGLIDLTEKLVPLIRDGGHIINMSSAAGSITEFEEGYPAYSISKIGVNMYTKNLAVTLKNRKINVSAFDPGWVRTDMGGPDADRDPSEPAEEIYNLATSKIDSGYFWHKGKKRNW